MYKFYIAFVDCSYMFRPLHSNHHHGVCRGIKEIIGVVVLVKQSVECVHVTFALRQDVRFERYRYTG
jgi:hypothetical protein